MAIGASERQPQRGHTQGNGLEQSGQGAQANDCRPELRMIAYPRPIDAVTKGGRKRVVGEWKNLEKRYWLRRKRDELICAESATSAEARLIHFDLAGRYSVKANNAGDGLSVDYGISPTHPRSSGNLAGGVIAGDQGQLPAARSALTADSAVVGQNSSPPCACQSGMQPL